ncbi:MAG: caspase family protein [Bacteroidales bacterium]|nr:caspase family protein [Bacteroidales bacterium]
MKRWLVISLALMLCLSVSAATKRALLVLIGDYPAPSGWNSLAGHNDKAILLEMLARNGFSMAETTILEDADATHDGIIAALRHLEQAAHPGDVIYIHFSCHGQQITDVDGDEALRDPRNHFDEALVPYDAAIAYGWNGYRGEHHLTDDQLNLHLAVIQRAVGRQGRVLLVADACHSGDIQRTEEVEGTPIRGTFDAFKLPLTGRSAQPVSTPDTWITLSACKEFQTNFEVTVNGIRYGRLTYAICQTLQPGMSPEALISAVQGVYQTLPLPPRKYQTAVLACPAQLQRKPVFR